MERIFTKDRMSKLERVEATLNNLPVDRAALHEQLSFNPGVISRYTGRKVTGFDYTYDDICSVIRQTVDACFPPVAPLGTGQLTDRDGFIIKQDNWHSMIVRRPFHDVAGAREFLLRKTDVLHKYGQRGDYGYPPGIIPSRQDNLTAFDPEKERESYRRYMQGLQNRIGETVIIDFSIQTGFNECWAQKLGLDIFSYLYFDDAQVITDYLNTYMEAELKRIEAIADRSLSPVVLIAEDFAYKGGTIFSPDLLRKELFPRIRQLTKAWHRHGLKVLFHSDGDWKDVIPDLVECGVDGFYCLEPSLGMDIVVLRNKWPEHVWAGGLDGVDLMELGNPDQVRLHVQRIIEETDLLHRGGVFIDTSSEINPMIKPENFVAMVQTVGEIWNQEL